MTIKRYTRIISEEIDAVRYDGENDIEISVFLDCDVHKTLVTIEDQGQHYAGWGIEIRTSTYFLKALVGDWIIRGFHGEIFCCTDEIFVRDFKTVPSKNNPEDSSLRKKCPSWCHCRRS